ncbi:helicase SNF2 (plasmid) [Pseudomonas oryzihabitans]|nr:helicase SNF2 [Pseudomonas psychrotolerans]
MTSLAHVPAVRLYGSVTHLGRYWRIACDPQVRGRLKRVFPKINDRAAEVHDLLASAENSRELRWFMERYPMSMDVETRALLDQLADQHVENERSLADLLAGRRELVARDMARPARQYQRLPATMMEIKGGLLLADDLGLGKTVSAILAMVQPGNLPAVVVYPASLPNHWPEKLAEFVPHLRVHQINSGKPYPLIKQPRQRRTDLWDTLPDVILVTYHRLRGWAEVLGEIAQYAVFEECQQLRNPGSSIYTACEYLAGHVGQRMGLSATPIFNYGGEFWNVINVLLPDALGDYYEFVREWCTVGYEDGKHRLKDPEAFGEHLRREGIMLRRTRAEVGRELPALTKITVEIEHDQRVLERYKSDALRLAQTILQKNQSYKTERMEAAGEFDRLMRQACGIAKAPYVADFVRMLVEEGRQVLLFGWHRDVYRIWLDALADLNPVMYTGSESAREKQAAKEAFVAGTARVIIISVRAGAGVDGLQAVSATTVHGELDWSPGVIEQNIGRVHRDGQPEPVQAYFPVCSDDFDQVMLDVLGVKREQIDGVISPDDNLVERLDIGQRQLRDVARRFLLSQGQAVPEDEEEDLQPLPQVLALPGAMPAPATEPNARQEVLF